MSFDNKEKAQTSPEMDLCSEHGSDSHREEQDNGVTTASHESPTIPSSNPLMSTPVDTPPPVMSDSVRTLKEAFPSVDVDVIEAILESQGNTLDSAFEVLLGMNDPSYKPEPVALPQQAQPISNPNTRGTQPQPPTTQPATQEQPLSVDEQLRMDEAFARQLALEDRAQRRQSATPRQQQPEEPFFNFQGKRASSDQRETAKKKVLDLYSQFKAATQTVDQQAGGPSSPGYSQRPQQSFNPREKSDQNLANDMSGLRLSDNPVNSRAPGPRSGTLPSADIYEWNGRLHSNGPTNPMARGVSSQSVGSYEQRTAAPAQTATSLALEEQIRKDEEFARQLASQEDFWERNNTAAATEPNEEERVNREVSQPRSSPLVHDDDLEGIDEGGPITFSAPDNTKAKKSQENNDLNTYIINDDVDDLDDLLDVDESPSKEKAKAVEQTTSSENSKSEH
ncbi:hypothetical protein PHYBLDRAFT_181937 [Phycomyces blakesleeanus NRRL 1555(-)]|uniref:CUE domain-containing protein n=1 Tax=Phycomyces blakesleeanus (strain ATCC 8743b / DSM 1359 / FGSC 10004 / NBRC 33097 / NRRL 1555) TaxID=763407 RepID=A0A162X1U9_PHYB8|nr:hypothetical protein PHYBLDRAFT_181937 [Phycomyces blakesleeanus NRRL 1555(-)]OAD72065.1 hypothetical protein PHYBLDRAFT_181937 [Phycomyces blakesleeanus NRRL 1555(-)]|eukprot:XP_018290105.1 hypothetical protein PHYBLDRAFT_181937 [Phycomyces blakesleeanus NRRL 1555(-)]